MKIFNLVKSEFKKNYNKKKTLLIILFSIISVISFVEIYKYGNDNNYIYYGDSIEEQLNDFKYNASNLQNKENRTSLEEYELYYYSNAIKDYEYLIEINADTEDFQYEVTDRLLEANYQNKIIDDIISNGKDEFLENCNILRNKYQNNEYQVEVSRVNLLYLNLCDLTDEDITKIYEDNINEIKIDKKVLSENKYYVWLDELNINYGLNDLLIEKKIADKSDYRVINSNQYLSMQNELEKKIVSEDEFINGYDSPYGKIKHDFAYQYDNHANYANYENRMKEAAKKNQAILLYSTKNDIKHDISFYYDQIWSLGDSYYITSKTCVNNIFHLSIVVLIIVSITSGGIVSKEHNTGTIKNIITTPVRRWKILLSKFIYLILHTYIIWFILLFILIIYSGIRFGFEDIFSPKLLYSGGKVIEVNYILYLIKSMLVAGIPMIAFLSILFFLSTITLNTALTVGITTILAIVSPIMWILIYSTKLYSMKFVPFMYFDPGFIINNSKEYSYFIKNTSMDFALGIIVSIICIVILYLITNIVYSKRDIKN